MVSLWSILPTPLHPTSPWKLCVLYCSQPRLLAPYIVVHFFLFMVLFQPKIPFLFHSPCWKATHDSRFPWNASSSMEFNISVSYHSYLYIDESGIFASLEILWMSNCEKIFTFTGQKIMLARKSRIQSILNTSIKWKLYNIHVCVCVYSYIYVDRDWKEYLSLVFIKVLKFFVETGRMSAFLKN